MAAKFKLDGGMISPLQAHVGKQASLQLTDRGTVGARVRWVRDGRIGVSFHAAQD